MTSLSHRCKLGLAGLLLAAICSAHQTSTPVAAEQVSAIQRTPITKDAGNAPMADKHEVKIQERMAVASEQMVALSKGQNLYATVGAIGLVITILFTGWAARSASIAAKAAVDSVGTERAWVITQGARGIPSKNITIDNTTYPVGVSFYVSWKNAGRTPAIGTQLSVQHKVMPMTQQECPTFQKDWGKSVRGDGAVFGPGQVFLSELLAIGGKEYEQFIDEKVKVYVFSAVRYSDTYFKNVMHESETCQELVVNGLITKDGITQPNVIVRPAGRDLVT